MNKLRIILFLLLIGAVTGCTEEKPQTDFVARVNNEYLLESDLAEIADTNSISPVRRGELIRKWIEDEALYQAAVEEGILETERFRQLRQKSDKEIARSLFLDTYFNENRFSLQRDDLAAFFEQRKEAFRLPYNAYYCNQATFSSRSRAIEFRRNAFESGWENALKIAARDTTMLQTRSEALIYEHQFFTDALPRVIRVMQTGDISFVISLEPERFTIVQLLQQYERNSVPPLDVIKDKVEKTLLQRKRMELLEELKEELFTENDIEIKSR